MKFRSIISVFAVLVSATLIFGSYRLAGSTSVSAAPAVTPNTDPTPQPKTAKTPEPVRELALTDGDYDGTAVKKTDAEWRAELTPDEYMVLRREGTERPYTGALTSNHKRGTYYCAACGLVIFSSEAKFESGTGWPSFFRPISKKNVVEEEDRSLGEVRTKVECARCRSHLGHVFDDGPQPTGLRYCMNSVALRFKPAAK